MEWEWACPFSALLSDYRNFVCFFLVLFPGYGVLSRIHELGYCLRMMTCYLQWIVKTKKKKERQEKKKEKKKSTP